jgi:hypothetical protein
VRERGNGGRERERERERARKEGENGEKRRDSCSCGYSTGESTVLCPYIILLLSASDDYCCQ